MKQSTKRLLSMVSGTVILVAAIFIYFNLAQPEFDAVQQVRSEYMGQKETLKLQEDAVKQVQSLIAKSKTDQNSDVINYVLPTEPDVANAVAQVGGIAEQNGLNLQSIGVNLSAIEPSGANPVAQPLGMLIIQSRLTGTYEEIKAFLHGIETNIRLMDVRSFSLQSGSNKPGENIYSLEFSIGAHYQPMPQLKTTTKSSGSK